VVIREVQADDTEEGEPLYPEYLSHTAHLDKSNERRTRTSGEGDILTLESDRLCVSLAHKGKRPEQPDKEHRAPATLELEQSAHARSPRSAAVQGLWGRGWCCACPEVHRIALEPSDRPSKVAKVRDLPPSYSTSAATAVCEVLSGKVPRPVVRAAPSPLCDGV
jgi:hypothetical protein